MFSSLFPGVHLIESSDRRLRKSRELSAKSHDYICRSRDLILQSKALLAQDHPPVPEPVEQPAVQRKEQPLAQPVPAPRETAASKTTKPTGDLLQVVSGKTIHGQVDGAHFIDCELLDCTLQYSGMPVMIESTRFRGCSFHFSGEAALTLRFLECFDILPETGMDHVTSTSPSAPQRPN